MAITRTKIFPVEGQSPIVLHNVPQSVELVGDIAWKDEEQTTIDDFTVKIKTKDEYSTGVPHKVIKRVDTLNTTSKTWTEGTKETYEAQEEELTLNYKGHERDFEVTLDEEGTPVIRYRWSMNDAHDLTIEGGGASVEILPLGGKIFYVDSGDNGATYHFYKEDGSEIEGWTDVSSLSNAVSYSIEGEPTTDKFYVFDNSENALATSKRWTYYENSAYKYEQIFTTPSTTSEIGQGKINTQTVMAKDDGKYITDNSNGYATIWYVCNEVNKSERGGCSDWFIPSEKELDALRTSSVVPSNWFSSNYIWTSSENSYNNARSWDYYGSTFYGGNKYRYYCCVCVRAF